MYSKEEVREIKIIISNNGTHPIYEQILIQIKEQIINGTLSANEPLPSIRNLAKDLRISVITTKRAYDELEKEGFIYTIPAKGCFVSERNNELFKEENLKKVESLISQAVSLSKMCNLTKKDLIDLIDFEMGEK